ncbi:MAG: DNA starvation/stationary phase protection protein Dps [Thermomicrobiales bacterium]|nr:DNA starvation/stationary phase protection protein Dps [Thermomicrobiales bacterium]MCB1685999.1 DNA starvation/stationary phase protection protein Dps [Pseudomonadales bacterium]
MPKATKAKASGKIASNPTNRTFETGVDLPADVRSAMVMLLNEQLATNFDLQSQVKQAHWNVKGIHFYPLHLLFDSLAEHLEDLTDEIAERVTTIGGYATGTVRMAAENSTLPELPVDINDGLDYVKALVDRYSIYGSNLRAGIDAAGAAGDADTADLLTEASRAIDKDLWFLQAHVQG